VNWLSVIGPLATIVGATIALLNYLKIQPTIRKPLRAEYRFLDFPASPAIEDAFVFIQEMKDFNYFRMIGLSAGVPGTLATAQPSPGF
jgi:hypothetical protein